MKQSGATGSVPVWDLPVRLFHWALVVLLVFSFVAVKTDQIDRHIFAGKLILSLILFRILWGFLGSETARFASFLTGPGTTAGYFVDLLRGKAKRYLGHNPMGAWSALVMILLIGAQAGAGLFATDDIMTDGPLKYLVSDSVSARLTTLHKYGENVLIALIVLHLLAVAFYLVFKRDNLVAAMITGRKEVGPVGSNGGDPTGPIARGGSVALALVLLAISVAIVFGGLYLYGR
jgi:cytochrome b